MITKETLELAAKAAGYNVRYGSGHQSDRLFITCAPDPSGKATGVFWSPSVYDSDAFRLQVDLGLNVFEAGNSAYACFDPEDGKGIEIRVPHNGDKRKATREAITLCAAEIGRMME